ncbi:UNVERIFIED_CONTAM: hypothetical protein HDU68_010288 [Siphonaria sp. JEL0065]|nr:hypothetical protein HDU68_010288 [Siphonaria sp. JEL0065]
MSDIRVYLHPLLGCTQQQQLRRGLSFLSLSQVEDLADATHIVANHVDFAEAAECKKKSVAIVGVSWLKTMISVQDRSALFGSVLAFGGQYRLTLAKDTTHYICITSNTSEYAAALAQSRLPQRFDQLLHSNGNPTQIFTGNGLKLVLPHYIDDCVRVKRRISDTLYLWPDVKVLKAIEENGVFGSAGGFVDTSKGESLVKGVPEAIQKCGGRIAQDYDAQCTIVILLKREGLIYVQASKNPTQLVGTPRYIHDCLKITTLTPPKHKLLHYPAPTNPIPQFKDLKICATNYVGQSRADIETMVVQLGGTYTRQMTQDNTHVICARPYSEKTKRATEWDISIVNHLWLEECYRQEKLMNCCRSEFMYYPVCLPRIVGEASLIPARIEKSVRAAERAVDSTSGGSGVLVPKIDDHAAAAKGIDPKFVGLGGLVLRGTFDEMDPTVAEEIENTPKEDNVKEVPTAVGQGEESTSRNSKSARLPKTNTSTAATTASKIASSKSLKSKLAFSISGSPATLSKPTTASKSSAKAVIELPVPPPVQPPSLVHHKSPARVYSSKRDSSATPPTNKVLAALVEEDPPSDSSSARERLAVQRVTKALNQVPNQPAKPASSSSTAIKRGRRSSVGGGGDAWTDIGPSSSSRPAEKRQRIVEPVRIICTGGSKIDKALWKEIHGMGGKDAMDIESCTHLVSNKVVRTEKFISALTLGKEIVTSEWVDKSVKVGYWLDVNAHRPIDVRLEYPGFSIQKSLVHSRAAKLLSGFHVYATPHVSPEWIILKRLVEIAGGKMVPPLSLRKLGTNDIRLFTHTGRQLNSSPLGSDNLPASSGGGIAGGTVVDSTKVILISCEDDDFGYGEKLRAFGLPVYGVEILISGLMYQELRLNDDTMLLSNGNT